MSVDRSGAFPIVTDQQMFALWRQRWAPRQYRKPVARWVGWPLSVIASSPHMSLLLVVGSCTLGSMPLVNSLVPQRPGQWSGLPYALCSHPATTISRGIHACDTHRGG